MNKPKLVEVEWVDSSSTPGWQSEIQKTPLTCYSAGYLIHKDKKGVVVALNRSPEALKNFGDTMTIPACCIIKIRNLR